MTQVKVRDLGPLLVELGESTVATGTKSASQWVPAHTLAQAAWDTAEEVSTARLNSQLWRLRNLLEPDRDRRSSSMLVQGAGGYRLLLDPDNVDSLRFERLAAEIGGLGVVSPVGEARTGRARPAIRRSGSAARTNTTRS
jgi:hypothetical protein